MYVKLYLCLYSQSLGVNIMEKTVNLQNASITFSTWDIGIYIYVYIYIYIYICVYIYIYVYVLTECIDHF
jgi:hypothetical protein